MRGKAVDGVFFMVEDGITPAHAGKRQRSWARTSNWWDHPRICGEKLLCISQVRQNSGSPPRMRGKADNNQIQLLTDRITPAHAGKSLTESETAAYCRDHPRACGEKLRLIRSAAWFPGSPPRMRGKVCRLGSKTVSAGITPAHAGKSGSTGTESETRRDHPRACGEKTLLKSAPMKKVGSPPRMRGKETTETAKKWT